MCGRGVTVPISVKPKPSRSIGRTASPSLSAPAARPSGFGNDRPKAVTARRGSSGGGAGSGVARSARRVARCAVSGSRRFSSGRASVFSKAIIRAGRTDRQCRRRRTGLRKHPRQWTRPARRRGAGTRRRLAKDLPAQGLAKFVSLDGDEHQIGLTGEVLNRCLPHLPGIGKVDETVGKIDRRAVKHAARRSGVP